MSITTSDALPGIEPVRLAASLIRRVSAIHKACQRLTVAGCGAVGYEVSLIGREVFGGRQALQCEPRSRSAAHGGSA